MPTDAYTVLRAMAVPPQDAATGPLPPNTNGRFRSCVPVRAS
jgi:hypothetical protein